MNACPRLLALLDWMNISATVIEFSSYILVNSWMETYIHVNSIHACLDVNKNIYNQLMDIIIQNIIICQQTTSQQWISSSLSFLHYTISCVVDWYLIGLTSSDIICCVMRLCINMDHPWHGGSYHIFQRTIYVEWLHITRISPVILTISVERDFVSIPFWSDVSYIDIISLMWKWMPSRLMYTGCGC